MRSGPSRSTTKALLAIAAVVAACGSEGGPGGDAAANGSMATTTSTSETDASTSTTTSTTSILPTTTSSTTTSTTTIPPTTTSSTTTSTTTPPSTTEVAADLVVPDLVVAGTVEGDAVLLTADGAGGFRSVLLWDGPSQEESRADEGPGPNTLDHVSVAPDGSVAYVGTCCEPISGAFFRTEPPAPIDEFGDTPPSAGYNPSVSPDGAFLAVGSIVGFPIAFLDRSTDTPVPWDGADRLPDGVEFFTPYDTAWLDERTAVVLGIANDADGIGWSFTSASIDEAGVETGVVVPLVDADDVADVGQLHFGGVVDGSILVHQDGASTARRFRPDGTELPDAVVLDAPARSMWFEDGRAPVAVDADGVLTVGDTVVPGEYLFARA